jgi:protein SCO1/2
MKKVRIALWALVAVAAAAAGLLLVLQTGKQTSNAHPIEGQSIQETIGGPFNLTGSDGKQFSSARLAGKPFAIFFGFTRCPDTCPTTLARLTRLRNQLPQGAASFAIVFVTVDPERDATTDVGRYSELFGSPVIGLTGSPAAIEQVKKEFSVFSRKVPTAGGDYPVDHTATVFLMDGNGRFVTSVSPDEGDDVALQKLRRVLTE